MREQRIRESFARQTMMQTLGAEITDVGQGSVTITAPILPGSRQQHGVAHAALSFAIGDSAAGYAALTLMPQDSEVMTAEMKINLLAPGAGDVLRATGKVIKPGRRLIIVTAEVHAVTGDEEKLIALLQGTMVPVAAG
ncbi:PaaI family thioesterase [Phaeobacter gallaeciensis]|uniref:Medium/long-chain acyl-CoA thioesterase YigI n=1 Tax=Phaeobacter gallaeciensis TaxID=60890 RepID=A0AAC9ZB55_9RHOB|nr:PaaI family thioesterase [Phaeobacter gallaeciensis]AHD10635.1 putative domain protein 1 [Phaeobacter gallaeciensis DSM 26640]ATE93898.1 putative domain protein 1 [Phaeobacter gallaeciensis]ATE96281.1 putative domain protein 1 [Phaeobacter gallaeciensis]ATF02562.1 putative domain protein 1 [Phaeobacter gallaeciensis]ATF06942.1 putative domain protein 1 [Phaeobacter gallaeciensis]